MNEMPEWFQGKVYSKGGVIAVDYLKEGYVYQKKVKLDKNALSMYHLIRGYQVLGKGNYIYALKGIEWIRDNYQDISEELFPIKDEKNALLRRIDNSTKKFRQSIYKLFSKE